MAPDAKHTDSFWLRYVLSCASATVAEGVTYPIDLVKTRLQIQGEIQTQPAGSQSSVHVQQRQLGMYGIASDIVRKEGVTKLWNGVTAAVLRHYIYTGVQVVGYEFMRDTVFHHGKDGGAFPLWQAILSGGTSGAVAQFFANPADLVKVQMQTEGKRRLEGHAPRVTSVYQALARVYSEGGITGLWKGLAPSCQRAALVNMATLATYDKVKYLLLKKLEFRDNYFTQGLSSLCSSLAAAIASTPADVVKTRIMSQSVDRQSRGLIYKSSMDCVIKTVKNERFFALYKGFIPVWGRLSPWWMIFWLSYERIRRLSGVSSF